jgi:hypothetical protein
VGTDSSFGSRLGSLTLTVKVENDELYKRALVTHQVV